MGLFSTASDIAATCLYLVYDPIAGSCTVASAGHLPPAVVTPDGVAVHHHGELGAVLADPAHHFSTV